MIKRGSVRCFTTVVSGVVPRLVNIVTLVLTNVAVDVPLSLVVVLTELLASLKLF